MKSKNSSRQVKVAVVGLGFMGVTHIKTYLKLKAAKIVAVCDSVRVPVNGVLPGVSGNITGSDAIDLGRKLKVYRDLKELLADAEVELVDLCVPTPLHPAQAIAALKAGKHVICEKPLALNSADGRKMVQAARAAKGFFMPAMCMRFWPGWSLLKDIVKKKPYGAVQVASFRRLSPTPGWSKATYATGNLTGGALFDLHTHDTDFVQFLFGRPQSVYSTGVTRGGNSIDHVVTQYNYPRGPVVQAEGTWLLHGSFNMSYTVMCERATLDYDMARGAEALRITEQGKKTRVIKCEATDGYTGELRCMLEAILTGKAPKVVTAEDGLSAVQICEAETKSVKTGKVVPV